MATSTNAEWCCADWLRGQLAAIRLPDALLQQISFRDASVPNPQRGPGFVHYPPPWPGCCAARSMGEARIWGDFCLSEWIKHAPWVFHPSVTPQKAAVLDTVASALRGAGEGSRTMWALDLLHPGEDGWLDHPAPGFDVSDLVQWGPKLSPELLADVDAMLSALGQVAGGVFGRLGLDGPNAETTFHGVRCYETTWWAGCG